MITKDSPTHELELALLEVKSALLSLAILSSRGLGTGNIHGAIIDLEIYEKQLAGYLDSRSPKLRKI